MSEALTLPGMPGLLKPFWRFYGSKWRRAATLPAPEYGTIVEVCAGAAGYSLRHHNREVVLIERDPKIADLWRWLIAASPADVRDLPLLEPGQTVASLGLPAGAGYLIGFWCGTGRTQPGQRLSTWSSRNGSRAGGKANRAMSGWSPEVRARVADQVKAIKHWTIIEGDWLDAAHTLCDAPRTWVFDPPYQSPAGRRYRYNEIDYASMGAFIDTQAPGQVLAFDQEGSTWRPWTDGYSERACNGASQEVFYHRSGKQCAHTASFMGYSTALCGRCGAPVTRSQIHGWTP